MAEPRFVGAPAAILLRGLSNRLRLHPEGELRESPHFYVPASQAATFPWVSHALWFYSQMVRWKQIAFDESHVAQVRATYRPDLYRLALGKSVSDVPAMDTKIEGFFDGRRFDPDDLAAYLGEFINK